MNRRQALSLLAALPFTARVAAQTRSTAQHRIAIAQTHGLLLEPDGSLKSWGYDVGQGSGEPAEDKLGLGHSRPIDPHVLYPVAGLTNVVAAAAGAASFAVLADGRLFAWGPNARGILGTTPLAKFEEGAQPRARTSTPTPVAVRFEAVDVSSRGDHAMALARDGSVYVWGYGTSGQLGIGPLPIVNFKTRSATTMPEVPYPVRVSDVANVVAISAGNVHSLALLKDGTVRAWGENKFGQVGDGTTVNRDRPVTVQGVRNAVAIAAGYDFSVAVLSDGTVMQWGNAIHESLAARPIPSLLAGARGIRSAVAGSAHVAALTHTGTVMTWGATAHYEVGRGPNPNPAPALVKGLTDVTSLAASKSTTTAVMGSGRIMTWGEVRTWTRPDVGMGANLSPFPILLWLDGLEQPG
jgi:alpha-tubulin suppressor-like RCC1 family protein